MDEFASHWNRKVSEIEGTSGLGPILLLTKGSNECISLVLWETSDQAVNWEKNTEYIYFKDTVRELVVEEPVRDCYEIKGTSESAKIFLESTKSRAA